MFISNSFCGVVVSIPHLGWGGPGFKSQLKPLFCFFFVLVFLSYLPGTRTVFCWALAKNRYIYSSQYVFWAISRYIGHYTPEIASWRRPMFGLRSIVCMFFTLNRSFYPSTSSTISVRADSSILEEIQVMWSQSYATEILRCHVCSKHSSGQCNAMSSYWIRQARHTRSMK